ncbi:hypothetical protein [Candidatus Electronema sp. PJ]|uniref:hypothetical protein n=1 Tax=Candidatus Electronema sp. PJ TaxID=3401572 RepID=UPI003AA9140C
MRFILKGRLVFVKEMRALAELPQLKSSRARIQSGQICLLSGQVAKEFGSARIVCLEILDVRDQYSHVCLEHSNE